MDSTLMFRQKKSSLWSISRLFFSSVTWIGISLVLSATQVSSAPFPSHPLPKSNGAPIRIESLPELHKEGPSPLQGAKTRPALSARRGRQQDLLSATPIPYEGLVSLSELTRKKRTPTLPKDSPEIQKKPLPPTPPTLDCAKCKSLCPTPGPKSLDLTNLQIIQCVENAANPAIRRSLLLALRNKDMGLFSHLVTQYDLLNNI